MKKTIVCFGDSNTHGYDAKTGGRFDETKRFTGLLSKALGEGYYVIEEGLGGRTTVFEDPLTEGLSSLNYIYPCLMSHEPIDLLIIMLGTNDTKERFNANARVIAKGLARLTAKAMTTPAWNNNKPNILLIAPAPIKEEYYTYEFGVIMGPDCSKKSYELADFYQKVAADMGCHFFDAGKVASVNSIDYMHLDENGHAALANALAELLPTLLS